MTNLYQSLVDYIKGSIGELRRVIWPSSQDTLRLTLVVIALSVAVAIILGAFDLLFQRLIQFLFGLSETVQ